MKTKRQSIADEVRGLGQSAERHGNDIARLADTARTSEFLRNIAVRLNIAADELDEARRKEYK